MRSLPRPHLGLRPLLARLAPCCELLLLGEPLLVLTHNLLCTARIRMLVLGHLLPFPGRSRRGLDPERKAQARRPVMDGNPALLQFASALRGSFQAISDHLSIGAHETTPRSALLKGGGAGCAETELRITGPPGRRKRRRLPGCREEIVGGVACLPRAGAEQVGSGLLGLPRRVPSAQPKNMQTEPILADLENCAVLRSSGPTAGCEACQNKGHKAGSYERQRGWCRDGHWPRLA